MTKPFDPAKYLDTSKAITTYMAEALETGDPAFAADAFDVIARARKMNKLTSE
jgi:probable addiction module antidote protein